MLKLVHRARRRLFGNELLSQGANTGSVTLAVLILLLLLGTEILNWRWLVALPLAAAVAGFLVARRRRPTRYRTAQILDGRAGLFDALSTAVHFRENPAQNAAQGEICAAQARHAERAAEGVDVRRTIPFRMPRAAYAMAALFLVASSLFALRYGLTSRLDLQTPLARIIQQRMGYTERTETARNGARQRPPQPGSTDDNGDAAFADQDRAGEPDPEEGPSEESTPANEKANSAGSKGDSKKDSILDNNPDVKPVDIDGQESDEQEDGNPSGNPGTPGSAKGDPKKEGNAKPEGSNTNDSSLLSKIKDAMQNLLSKVKPQQGGQQAADENGKQSKNQPGNKQQASKDGQQSGDGQQSDSQEGEQGEQSQSSQDSQGKSANKNDSPQTSKQQGSGQGSQEGDKSIKQAEQLAAMGKISEIIGKRSATLSGEATVEVQSTKQTLHTPYSQKGAQHSQGGAEINRDEIPVALQSYVQQYFEQVRKQAPAPAKK